MNIILETSLYFYSSKS